MKVLLLADVNSIHTVKWARGLTEAGLQISIFSLSSCRLGYYYDEYKRIRIISPSSSLIGLSFILVLPLLIRTIRELKPDIVHAHYASSYGLLGSLSNFHPYIISIWGTDIFEFPKKTLLHKWIIKRNLSQADRILSTSIVMAREAGKYSRKEVAVTPFGVDLDVFKPRKGMSLFPKNNIVIGTIRSLEAVYGIEYLIQAFGILKRRCSSLPLKLLIVGSGSQEQYLRNMAKELGVSNDTVFAGYVSYDEIHIYQNMMTIFAALSNQEGFGAAVVEASACGKPVVATNVGGLAEIVQDNVTGFIVPPRDAVKAADALERLALDENLREKMGIAGRSRVERYYDWNKNVNNMISIYRDLVEHSA